MIIEEATLGFWQEVIRTQGLTAVMLFWLIVANARQNDKLMKKNCELSTFIMHCLEKELDHERKEEDKPENLLEAAKGVDHIPVHTNINPDIKLGLRGDKEL